MHGKPCRAPKKNITLKGESTRYYCMVSPSRRQIVLLHGKPCQAPIANKPRRVQASDLLHGKPCQEPKMLINPEGSLHSILSHGKPCWVPKLFSCIVSPAGCQIANQPLRMQASDLLHGKPCWAPNC